jgi:hypothetical protein
VAVLDALKSKTESLGIDVVTKMVTSFEECERELEHEREMENERLGLRQGVYYQLTTKS